MLINKVLILKLNIPSKAIKSKLSQQLGVLSVNICNHLVSKITSFKTVTDLIALGNVHIVTNQLQI